MNITSVITLAILGVIFLTITGCAFVSTKATLHGKLEPYELKTRVDSRYAAYYLNNYLAEKNTDPILDAKLDALHHKFGNRIPDRDILKSLSKEYSVDFAALFWGHQILSLPKNRAIQNEFITNLENVKRGKAAISNLDYTVMLVPGLDYKKNGQVTGADLKAPIELLRQLGVSVYFVEIPPLGTVDESAQIIADAIRSHPHKKILIGGPSSAGPAIHLALATRLSSKESDNVAAWVSLGGVINGSPVIDWMDSGITLPLWRLILWFKGWNRDTFTSLRADVSRKRFASLTLPEHIKTISYIGLSLSGDISRFAKDKYCIMRPQGPNDGLALLPDMVIPNSYTIIAPTSDHFFAEDPSIKEKTVALLITAVGLL